jgi:hypothetical protein
VLARLEQVDGLNVAETDEAGDYLRLTVRDHRAVSAARDALVSLGYSAEPADEGTRVARWFGVRTVRELSLIEAGVIADRVLPQLRSVTPADAARLRTAIVGALHACFVNTDLTSAPSGQEFRGDCVRQTVAAATPIIGEGVAAEFGRLLDLDMRETHKAPRQTE